MMSFQTLNIKDVFIYQLSALSLQDCHHGSRLYMSQITGFVFVGIQEDDRRRSSGLNIKIFSILCE